MAGDKGQLMDFYPYRNRFQTYQRLEPRGRDRQDMLDELRRCRSVAVVSHWQD